MDDQKLKNFDQISDESYGYEKLFEGQKDEETVNEISSWLNNCAWQGTFVSPETGERRALRSIIERWKSDLQREGFDISTIESLADFSPDAGIVLDAECPYPGLDPYQENLSNSFFGRDSLVSYAIDLFKQEGNRVLLLVGASGSGKSSVALAGIIPALKKTHSHAWDFCPSITPGLNPINALAKAVAAGMKYPDKETEFERTFTEEPEKAYSYLAALETHRPLLFLIDQFEELFTLCNDDVQKSALGKLLYVLTKPNSQEKKFSCKVLLTLRTDHQSRFESNRFLSSFHKQLFDDSSKNVRYLTTIDFFDIKQAIRKPAEEVGLRFIPERLISQLASQTAGLANGLPLLQFTLQKLWKERPTNDSGLQLDLVTKAMVDELGQVERALGNVAKGIYDNFSPEQQKICERLLLELIVLDDRFEEPMRRRRNKQEILDVLESLPGTSDDIQTVIQSFYDEKLIRLFGDESEVQIEVAHEALLRHWDHIYNLLMSGEVKERILLIKKIGREAQEWISNKKSGDYLYQKGEPLKKACQYKEQKWLQEEESAIYIQACVAEEERLKEKDRLAIEQDRLIKEAESHASEQDRLRQEAERQQRKIQLILIAGMVSMIFVATIGALWMSNQNQRKNAKIAELISLGHTYLQIKNFEEARRHFNEAIDITGEKVNAAQLGLGWVDLNDHKFSEAQKRFEKLLNNSDPNDPFPYTYYFYCGKSLLYVGLEKQKEGLIKEAQENFAKAQENVQEAIRMLEKHPYIKVPPDYYYDLGLTNRSTGNKVEALENFKTALELLEDQESETAILSYYNLGLTYHESHQFDKAEEALQKGLQAVYPKTETDIRVALVQVYLDPQNDQNKIEEAKSQIKTLLARSALSNQEKLDYQVKLAEIYLRQNDQSKIEEVISQIETLLGRSALSIQEKLDYKLKLAEIYLRVSKSEKAKELCKDILQGTLSDQQKIYVYTILGHIYSKEKDFTNAVTNYLEAKKLNNQDSQLALYLADAYMNLGKDEEKQHYITEAEKLAINDPKLNGKDAGQAKEFFIERVAELKKEK